MEYFIKFSAVLALFWCIYKLFLQQETFFNAIRAYFILGILASLLVPLITIPEYVYLNETSFDQIAVALSEEGPMDNAVKFNFNYLLLAVYGIGMAFFTGRLILQILSLYRFIRKYPRKKHNGHVFVEADASTSPFSFFNYIVYPKKGFDPDELDQIIEHEKVHATHYHSVDILLGQLLIIFNWYNPIAWLYQMEIQKNLEFIADKGAHSDNLNKESYQYVLLKTVTPKYSPALTSNFYNSLIKKRINMLHRNKSGNWMHLKFIFIIPLLIAFVFTFNTKVVAQQKKGDKATHEYRTELEVQVITKDFQKSDLSELKTKLLKKGITLEYRKLKYNDNNEIIGIQLSVSNKQNKTQIEQSGTDPIKPISIKYDDKGSIALGNLDEMDHHNMYFTSADDEGKNVFVVKTNGASGSSSDHYTWVTKDGDKTEVKVVNGEKVIVRTKGDDDVSEGVWVSASGDSTMVKKIKVVEIEETNDGEQKVVVKTIHEGEEDEDIIVETSVIGNKDEKTIFINGHGEKPLVIVDGVEKPGMNMDDIDPEDVEKIEVLKGDKAIEKYGQKAKDGVVLITTRK